MLLENMNGFCHTAMLDQAPADTIPSVRIQCGTKSGWRKAAHPTRHSEKLSLTNDFFTISHTISIAGTIEKHFMCISFQIMKFTRHDKHMLCTYNTVELSSYVLVFFYIEVQLSWRATITTCLCTPPRGMLIPHQCTEQGVFWLLWIIMKMWTGSQ